MSVGDLVEQARAQLVAAGVEGDVGSTGAVEAVMGAVVESVVSVVLRGDRG